jgi:4-carboxymuconolactone decarboxylase
MSENSDFGTFGRYTEIPLAKMSPDQKKAYDFTVKERRVVGLGVDGPFKIWLRREKPTPHASPEERREEILRASEERSS